MECQNLEEALEACAAGADIVMLDNCDHTTIGASAKEVKDRYPHVLVEASGVSCAISHAWLSLVRYGIYRQSNRHYGMVSLICTGHHRGDHASVYATLRGYHQSRLADSG